MTLGPLQVILMQLLVPMRNLVDDLQTNLPPMSSLVRKIKKSLFILILMIVIAFGLMDGKVVITLLLGLIEPYVMKIGQIIRTQSISPFLLKKHLNHYLILLRCNKCRFDSSIPSKIPKVWTLDDRYRLLFIIGILAWLIALCLFYLLS